MERKLDTLLNVILSEMQVKEALRIQRMDSKYITQIVSIDEMVFAIDKVIEMYREGRIVVSEGKLVPKGFGYRALSELNNLEDTIMNNIHKVKMPVYWA